MITISGWVNALRSNKFKQGVDNLNFSNTYCCLGVLCELNSNTLKLNKQKDGDFTSYDNHYRNLPSKVSSKYTFNDEIIHTLIKMNDGGYTFSQIADKIEEWHQQGKLLERK